MKRDKINEYIFSTILILVLFFNLFVPNVLGNNHNLAIFLGLYLIICAIFVKPHKTNNKNKKKVVLFMTVLAIIYVMILYIIGIFSGFYRNSTSISLKVLIQRIIPITAIIIISEVIRYIFVTKNNKKSTIIITISLIFVDILTHIKIYNVFNLEEILALIGYVGLASVSTNLLSNYIVKRYGYIPNILYRVITTIYIYVFPVLPDIYLFFQTAIRIMYP